MKNELHPWEVGIAEQIKGKEFSFDPQAFADFEQLLEAEALGQLPGEQAPKATGETMSSGGRTISLPTILLVIGLACLAGWWLWPTVDNEAATALPSTSSKELTDVTSSALPSILPAPAAAPSLTVVSEERPLQSTQFFAKKENADNLQGGAVNNELAAKQEEPQMTDVEDDQLLQPGPAPRALRAAAVVTMLPLQPVSPLNKNSSYFPEIRAVTPKSPKRNRKALFPDVIKKN
jgi:hypothetical protein